MRRLTAASSMIDRGVLKGVPPPQGKGPRKLGEVLLVSANFAILRQQERESERARDRKCISGFGVLACGMRVRY